MEEGNELRLHMLVQNPFCHWSSRQNHQYSYCQSSSPNCCFLASWWYWISWLENYKFLFARLWFCEDIHHSSILKLAIEKAIQKSTNADLSNKLFPDDSNYEKKNWWVCVFTQKGHIVDFVPYSQLGCLPYWFPEEHSCDMHPYSTKSHYVKYAGLVTLVYAINSVSQYVLVFHCHNQWVYWRRFSPKSTLNGWLWGYGIWCYTIDSKCGSKFIYNNDQHANTYVSVWGCFPVGKIWSSHSTIKSRSDKP